MENSSHKRQRQELRSSTSKARSLLYSDDEISTDRSKRSRSRTRSTNLPSEYEKDPSVLDRAAANWSGSEYEPETSLGKPHGEPESEHEASRGRSADREAEFHELEPDRDETARKSVGSEYEEASDRTNPWVAECDHGAAFLRCPILIENQPIVQNPDPSWRRADQLAQPLICASWRGVFVAWIGERRLKYGGLNGYVSIKACSLARRVVERLPTVIEWEAVPKYSVWPKSFERCGPTDNNIAAFFFPARTRYEAEYDYLVMDLIRDDLALKTKVMGAELLLFTSVELPPLFTRFQGKIYLWGVFRGTRPQLL